MPEKTLGQVAYEALATEREWRHLPLRLQESWQAVADAVVSAYEERRWKAIESAPKDGTEIDVWADGSRHCGVEWWPEKTAWAVYGYDSMECLGWHVLAPQPTHWTPIPTPPQEVER